MECLEPEVGLQEAPASEESGETSNSPAASHACPQKSACWPESSALKN